MPQLSLWSAQRSHAELYRTKGGALASIADILMGS
jgi:hypothetical protein